MITSAVATTEPGQCPCGLTFEALDRHGDRALGPGMICLALGADGNPCNRRWADHPHEKSKHNYFPIAIFSFFSFSIFFIPIGLFPCYLHFPMILNCRCDCCGWCVGG